MCPLCNKDRPCEVIANKGDPYFEECKNIILEYLGEPICKHCIKSLTQTIRRNINFDIDVYVLRKLYYNYRPDDVKDLRRLVRQSTIKHIRILPSITKIYNSNTGHTMYSCGYQENKKFHLKHFMNLEDCVEFRLSKFVLPKSKQTFIIKLKQYIGANNE